MCDLLGSSPIQFEKRVRGFKGNSGKGAGRLPARRKNSGEKIKKAVSRKQAAGFCLRLTFTK